jgi:hypothetical protein
MIFSGTVAIVHANLHLTIVHRFNSTLSIERVRVDSKVFTDVRLARSIAALVALRLLAPVVMLPMGFIWEAMESAKLVNNCLAPIVIPAIKVAVWLVLLLKFWIKPRVVIFIHSGNKTCVSCSVIPNCINCVTGPLCTTCSAPFYLDYSTRKF